MFSYRLTSLIKCNDLTFNSAYYNGNIMQIMKPEDSNGDTCGEGINKLLLIMYLNFIIVELRLYIILH